MDNTTVKNTTVWFRVTENPVLQLMIKLNQQLSEVQDNISDSWLTTPKAYAKKVPCLNLFSSHTTNKFMSENQVRSYLCSGVNVPQLTSSLQVGCDSPVLHPELGRVRSVLKGGKHFSTHFPIAGGKREWRVLQNMWDKMKAIKRTDFSTERAEGRTNLLFK